MTSFLIAPFLPLFAFSVAVSVRSDRLQLKAGRTIPQCVVINLGSLYCARWCESNALPNRRRRDFTTKECDSFGPGQRGYALAWSEGYFSCQSENNGNLLHDESRDLGREKQAIAQGDVFSSTDACKVFLLPRSNRDLEAGPGYTRIPHAYVVARQKASLLCSEQSTDAQADRVHAQTSKRSGPGN